MPEPTITPAATTEAPQREPHGQGPGIFYTALGWMLSECCEALERGDDPRKLEVPELVHQAEQDLAEELAEHRGRQIVSRKSALLIAEERARQIEEEGYTESRDAAYVDGELAMAAGCYALAAAVEHQQIKHPPTFWPWPEEAWKPKDARQNLIRAGALILAELDRLDRITATNEG